MRTAMLYGPGGAQRVTVLEDRGDRTLVETRDGDKGLVETRLLQDFRDDEA